MGENVVKESSGPNLRPMQCDLKPLSRADGAAFLSQGDTVVLASAYGPIEAKQHNSHLDKAVIEVTYRPKGGLPGVKDRFRESVIKKICETALLSSLHPRTAVSIQIQELEDCGGIEACSVNAACLALLVSGISMKFTVAGVHCIINDKNELILDPNEKQSVKAVASFTFIFDGVEKNLIASHTIGSFSLAQYNEAHFLCQAASENLFQFYKNVIKKSITYKMEAMEPL